MKSSRAPSTDSGEHQELETLYRTAPLGMGLVDRDLRYVRVNEQLAEFAGMTPVEMLGRTTREVVPEIAEKTESVLRKVLDTGQAVLDLEVSGATRAKPDRERYWLASYSPLEYESGNVAGVSITVREVTESKQARQALEQQLVFQRLLTELSAQFAGLNTREIDEAIEAVFARIGTLLAIDRVSLVFLSGKGDGVEISHGFARNVEDLPPRNVVFDDQSWIVDVIRKGKTLRVSGLSDVPLDSASEREYMLQQGFKACLIVPVRSGEAIVAAITYSDMKSEREWPDYLVEQLSVISQLIGNALSRKRTGQLLAASQEQFRDFMDNNPAGAYMKDRDLRHIYANKPLLEMYGLSLDEFAGTTSRDYMRAEIAANVESADREILSGKTRFAEIEICVDMEGSDRWFRDTKFALASADGVPRVGGIALEITERKKAELDLEQHARFESLLSEISARFVNVAPEEIDAAITQALEQVALCLEFDRCNLGHLTADGARVQVTHAWSREPLEVAEASYSAADFPWFLTPFVAGVELLWSRDEGLPDASDADLRLIEALEVQGFAGIPVMVGGEVAACLAFVNSKDPAPWKPRVLERLRLLSRVFGNAIERQRRESQLLEAYEQIRELKEHVEAENITLKREVQASIEGGEIVGKSRALTEVLLQVGQVAGTDSTVLLLGETGVGKELIAREIHARSRRKDSPLITVNCAALPSSLIESELFGHERGAFTGAVSRKIGRFEVADEGTLLLDEIGDLAPELQAKLLRVLQEGKFERLGSTETRTVDVRVIAATNRDLESMVESGGFRDDLYYRLGVFPIRVPPLRERGDDIPLLAWYFVSVLQGRLGKTIDSISPRAMDALCSYDWPGNVRELQNVVERAMILSTGGTLDLSGVLPVKRGRASGAAAKQGGQTTRLEDAERNHIESVLEQCGWKVGGKDGAADKLGLKRSTLQSRMKKLGIRRPGGQSQ